MDFLNKMKETAKQDMKTIVLPEGSEPRTVKAVGTILKEGFANIVLLGKEEEIKAQAVAQGVDISGAKIVDPETSPDFEEYANNFYEMRKKKGMTPEEAKKMMANPLYFGVMMVEVGAADGMVSGAINSTANTLRPALQILKTAPDAKLVSSFMLELVPNCEYGEDGVFMFADISLEQDPDAEKLSEIALMTAKSFKQLVGAEPKVAMLSYSTYGSAKHDLVTKVQEATKLAKEKAPDLALDGELQLDAAIIPSVGKQKAPESKVAGYANVLIFPDLNAGNIGYKLAQRLAKAEAYGPILQGIKKPVNDLSRGCLWEDIVGVVAITAVQAQNQAK
ncbi:MAG: phosphate acetyltransferase [Firmicutes bacterium]|nr:phosphate acetyltransferase [Bacillota bacterium]